MPRTVLVPRERVVRWFDNFAGRHGETAYVGARRCAARRPPPTARPPSRGCPSTTAYDGPADAAAFAAAVTMPRRVGRAAGPQGRLRRRRRRVRPGRGVQGRPAARAGPHQGRRAEPAAVRPAPRQPGAAGLRGGRRARARGSWPAASTRWCAAGTGRRSSRCSPTRGCAASRRAGGPVAGGARPAPRRARPGRRRRRQRRGHRRRARSGQRDVVVQERARRRGIEPVVDVGGAALRVAGDRGRRDGLRSCRGSSVRRSRRSRCRRCRWRGSSRAAATTASRVQRAGRDPADVVVEVLVAARALRDLVGAVADRGERLAPRQPRQRARPRAASPA